MKLSCVTATFNCIKSGNRDRLIRCVESVAKLTTEHEHLIYDGASTDGTFEVLRELAANTPGLKVFSEPDTGIYNALNKGVRDAKGEWFYVLGADDYISHPQVMDSIINAADRATNVIITSVERDGKIMEWFTADNIWRTLVSMPHSHQGMLIRTNDCRGYKGYDERFKICADYDMLLKAHKSALRFQYLYEPFAEFSPGGVSSNSYEETDKDFMSCRANFLGLSEGEKIFYDKYGHPPLRAIIPYLFHKDEALRCSSRYLLKKWLQHYIFPFALAAWLRRYIRNYIKGR